MDFDIDSIMSTGKSATSNIFSGLSDGFKSVTDFFSTGFSWSDVAKNVGTFAAGFVINNAQEIGSWLGNMFSGSSGSSSGSSSSSSGGRIGVTITGTSPEQKAVYNTTLSKYYLYINSAGEIVDMITQAVVVDSKGISKMTWGQLKEKREIFLSTPTGLARLGTGWRADYRKTSILYWL